MKRSYRSANVLSIAAVALLLAVSTSPAAKPAPAPPPTGTIYFLDDAGSGAPDVVALAPDGSAAALALPTGTIAGGFPEPSVLTYAGEPLWLVRGDEIFVLRREADGSVGSLQLTQVRPELRSVRGPRWANSALDEFVSFEAVVTDGTGVSWNCIYRLHVSGAELTAALDAGGEGWVPFGPDDPRLEVVVCLPLPDLNIVEHDWAPDGSRLVYRLIDDDAGESLVVRSVETGAEQVIFGGRDGNAVFGPRWSPDGSRIVVLGWNIRINATKRVNGLWTLAPDGSNATLIVREAANTRLGTACWSPDSRYLVHELIDLQRPTVFDDEYDVVRIKADGSGATVLTQDFDPLSPKSLLQWR